MNLKDQEWQNFFIEEVFYIQPTRGSTTNELIGGKDIPYIAAKKESNGVAMMCSKEENEDYISKGNCIVFIQLGQGSVGYSLYQGFDFIGMSGKISCGYNSNLNQYSGLFIVSVLDLERPKYSFGRSWTGNRLRKTKIKLPVDTNGNLDWQFMEDYVKYIINNKSALKVRKAWNKIESLKEPYYQKKLSLQSRKWKWFKYKEIFFVESGKGSNIYDLDFNGKCPYISSISVNNGIIGLINSKESDIHNGNTITINRTGSVGEAFYQKYSYVASKDRIRVLIPKFLMTDFSGMFLATLIQKEKYRFNYGRTWGTSRIKESLIKLPVNEQGEPDWQFMEDYVKSLPYSKNLEAEQKISERKVW